MANRYPKNNPYHWNGWFPQTDDSNQDICVASDQHRVEDHDEYNHIHHEKYDENVPIFTFKNSHETKKIFAKKDGSSLCDVEANFCRIDNFMHFDSEIEPTQPIKNINFVLPEPDVESHLEPEEKKPTKICLDWNDYYRLNVIHDFLDGLEYDYPSLCTSAVIGHSVEGRELKIVKISNTNMSNTCVWIDGGIHAREWISPAVNTFIANYIATNFNNLPESCKNKDWYFLPVLNPDGYEYSHTTDRLWRKNRAYRGTSCFGVDLNRNFSYGWGGPRSSAEPNHVFYRGRNPFSEPESSAMRDFFINSGIKFQVYITLHSFGQYIVFPFACRDTLAPDYIRLLEGATVMSKAIYDTTGSIYKVGISKDVMYGASGTSNDWCHGVAGVPYCYLIELRSKEHKFKLPKEEIEDTGREILNSVIELVDYLDKQRDVKVEETEVENIDELAQEDSEISNYDEKWTLDD